MLATALFFDLLVTLIALGPIFLLYLIRSITLAAFLLRVSVKATMARAMYTTLAHTFLRRGALLSQHPRLRNWYYSCLLLAYPLHLYAYTAIIVSALSRWLCVHAAVYSLLLTTLSLCHARSAHLRFYLTCVTYAVEETLGSQMAVEKYARSRAERKVCAAQKKMEQFIETRRQRHFKRQQSSGSAQNGYYAKNAKQH